MHTDVTRRARPPTCPDGADEGSVGHGGGGAVAAGDDEGVDGAAYRRQGARHRPRHAARRAHGRGVGRTDDFDGVGIAGELSAPGEHLDGTGDVEGLHAVEGDDHDPPHVVIVRLHGGGSKDMVPTDPATTVGAAMRELVVACQHPLVDPEADGDQHPEHFGIGRLFWLTSEAIVGADLAAEEIVLWNPAAARLFGYSVSEALGMPLDRLVPEFIRPQHLAGIRRYRQGDGPPVLVGAGMVQVPAQTKDGSLREISLSLTDVSDGTANRYVLAMVRDVTAVAEAERSLQRTNQAMKEFVATASHDLRTPLTSVLGFARMLRDQSPALNESDREMCIDAILRGATQANRLVDDLLTLSQLQAGVVTTKLESVPVAALAREAAARNGVDAVVEVDDSVEVSADAHHVERILGNYLSNAARYGRAPIRVTSGVEDGHVVIRVCDAGDGVPENFVDRLFTAFSRVDPGTGEGTGLGLSIIKGLAEANGGDVLYERFPDGGGVCFGVRLPMAAA